MEMITFNPMRALLFFTVLLFIWGCKTPKESQTVLNIPEGTPVFEVVVKVTQTKEYCGGARPPKELLEELNTPKPLGEATVHFRKGSMNDLDSAIIYSALSDTNGVIRVKLPEGTYGLVFDHKKDNERYDQWLSDYSTATAEFSAIDKNCLDKWMETPDVVISVKEGGNHHFTINQRENCIWNSVPCVRYLIGMPPSAPPQD